MDNNNKWDELSLTEKSEIMRQAVANGITNLNEIRQTYNEHADGGSMDEPEGTVTENRKAVESAKNKYPMLDNLDFSVYSDPNYRASDYDGYGDIEVFHKGEQKIDYTPEYSYPNPNINQDNVLYNPDRIPERYTQDAINLDAISHLGHNDPTYDALNATIGNEYPDAATSEMLPLYEKMTGKNLMKMPDSKRPTKNKWIPQVLEAWDDAPRRYQNAIDGLVRDYIISKEHPDPNDPIYKGLNYVKYNPQWDSENNSPFYLNQLYDYITTGRRPANILPEVIVTGHKHAHGGKVAHDARYNHVTQIYQSYINQGVNPQAALELTNQKIAEKGWTGWVSGDNKRYGDVNSFTGHTIDQFNRLYPDSLKSNNFNQFFQGIEGGRTKYNPTPNIYRQHLLQTRPGVKKRINEYRRLQGQSPLSLVSPTSPPLPWEEGILYNPQLPIEIPTEQPVIAADGGYLYARGGKLSQQNQRAGYAVDYFMNKGLSREAAAGKMYDDGGVTSSNGQYHVNPTDYLDVLSNVENNKPVEVTLPDVTVKAADPKNYRSSYDPNGFMDFMNAVTLGVGNRFSVSQDARLVKDIYDATTGNKSWKDVGNSAIFGNEGIFENPNYNLALDIISPTLAYSTYKLPSLLRNYSLGIPNKTGRYFRIVGNASTPQGDAIADANATGIIRSNAKKVNVAQSKSGRRFTFGKEYSYPMFSKDKVWQGSTGIGESLGKTDRIIRTKADTGPTIWEESRIDFNHKNHAGIFRPNYLGDINAFPTRYAEWWERIGNNPITRYIWKRHDFDNVEWKKSSANSHAYGGPLESDEDNLLAPIIKYYEDSNPSLSTEDQNTFAKGGQIKKARQAVDYFVNKGLTKAQAAGLVGNLMRESGMNIATTNPNSGAYGLGQWLGSRKTKLFKKYGRNPSFYQQLDYIWDELNTSHRKGLQMLKSSKTVDEAARNAFGYYEFSDGPQAAIAAMNKNGKNTKWKNPNGTVAMNDGITNAWVAYGKANPNAKLQGLNVNAPVLGYNRTIPNYDFTSAVDGLNVEDSIANFSGDTPKFQYDLFPPNPTNYGTPIDWSTPEKKVETPTITPKEDNNELGLLALINQIYDSPKQEPLATYTPQRNNSMFVVNALSSSKNDTLLDNMWFSKGDYLYNDRGSSLLFNSDKYLN